MKVVIFCGGQGLRLRDFSETIPKPMVPVGFRPIIWHTMKYYAHYGHKEFILALGHRADAIKDYFLNYSEAMSNDFVLTNLTLHNTTPKGGSQAESLILVGGVNARAIITGVDLYSLQDTLQINGQAYVSDCYIEGDVDFMWGSGPCFFENCECKSANSRGYYTQIRNPSSNHGYIYRHCLFNGKDGVTGNLLSRIDPARFPGSEVVLIDCTLTDAVSPAAWRFDGSQQGPNVHFWEYNSHAPDGKPIDMSARFAGSKRLEKAADAETIAHYSDPVWVLGGNWNPRQAPVFAGRSAVTSAAPATR